MILEEEDEKKKGEKKKEKKKNLSGEESGDCVFPVVAKESFRLKKKKTKG